MGLERTGIPEQRAADRERWKRYAYHAPAILVLAPEPETVVEPAAPSATAPPPVQPDLAPVSPTILVPDDLGGRPRRFRPDKRFPELTILAAVCMAFGVTPSELMSISRPQRLARARFAACKLLRDKRNLSYPNIGRVMKQDHSTAVHSYRRAAILLVLDPEWARRFHAAELALVAT